MKLKAKVISLLNSTAPARAALEWWVHHQTEIYVLSYPKCGRTWLRLMIGKALDEHYHLGVANPMELNRFHAVNAEIPRIRVTHEAAHKLADIGADKTRFRDKTVVFLVRDPRDVVVSMFFEATRRTGTYTGTIGQFIREPIGGLDAILDYYNVWAAAQSIPRRFHLVRYEDLHADPAATLSAVLTAMAVPVGPAALDAAIGFSRFDNMRALETANAFNSARLAQARTGDAESFKTRKGKVGGYRDYLTGADLDYVQSRISTRLSPLYASYRATSEALRA